MFEALLTLTLLADPAGNRRFTDATTDLLGEAVLQAGLLDRVARACLVDLDDDGWPDLVVDRHLVFLNRPADGDAGALATSRRRFITVDRERTGLDAPLAGTVVVFADLDNDGFPDAVIGEYCDVGDPEWIDHGRRSRLQRGRGDGTFEPATPLPTPPRPTIAIAVGDVDRDGLLDLWFGNSYVRSGQGYEAWPNDLLIARRDHPEAPPAWDRFGLPEDDAHFDEERDLAGRPTYGLRIAPLAAGVAPSLLELAYGRRWNRLWHRDGAGPWSDLAPRLSLDGDEIRHGRYPEWLRERAATDPRFDRQDERPFRSNGNTFDAAIGDLDGDGRLDLLITEITHAWAGESSDRTRILFQREPDAESAIGAFREDPAWSLDRIPPAGDPDERRWNQGDLFGAFADLDHDGRLEVILSSAEYPDDERLRVWRVRAAAPEGAMLEEVTSAWAIDHDGSQQISLGDIDGDGALDLVVGQGFHRYPAERIAGRTPRLRIFRNEVATGRPSIILRLEGDGVRVNRAGIGAIVEAHRRDGSVRVLPLLGPGGHAGGQHDFVIHFVPTEEESAEHVERIVIHWPGAVPPTTLKNVPAGAWRVSPDGRMRPLRSSE